MTNNATSTQPPLDLLLDLALTPRRPAYFGTERPLDRVAVRTAMDLISAWNRQLTRRTPDRLSRIDGITIYDPRDAARRSSLVAFNLRGRDPVSVATGLNRTGVESRAGCHCATLAHHALGLTPPASCRLSFTATTPPASSPGRSSWSGPAGRDARRKEPIVNWTPYVISVTHRHPSDQPEVTRCPGCDTPAGITERFSLPSTDGWVEHIAVACSAGHHFRMPATWTADRQAPDDWRRPAPDRR